MLVRESQITITDRLKAKKKKILKYIKFS
jgi:hypothetical protein